MQMPSYTQLPGSQLSRASLIQKFNSTSLAGAAGAAGAAGGGMGGLGDAAYDEESGAWIDTGTAAGTDTTATALANPFGIVESPAGVPNPNVTHLDDPFGVYTSAASVGAGAGYVATNGDYIIPESSGGGYVAISPGGTAVAKPGAPPSRGSALSTASQQAAQYQLYTAMVKGGLDIAKLVTVQPGTTLTPTSIVRQNPGYSAIAPGQLNANLGLGVPGMGISTNTLLLLGLGLVVVMSMSKQRGGG